MSVNKDEFKTVEPRMRGIRCYMHEDETRFPGTLLEHLKKYHYEIWLETVRLNHGGQL